MALPSPKKELLLDMRISAIEKVLEELTGAYSGHLLNVVNASTADAEIIAEAEKIKPVRTHK